MKIYRTPAQEAERLQISLRAMREMIRRREFSTYRIGHKLLLVADEVDGTLELTRQRAYSEPKRHAGRTSELQPQKEIVAL